VRTRPENLSKRENVERWIHFRQQAPERAQIKRAARAELTRFASPAFEPPTYRQLPDFLFPAWDWLEKTAATLTGRPAIIIGDLNVQTSTARSRAGDHFRRLLANGWHRAEGAGPTFFGYKGRITEVDHVLA
jgi:endonuclease/exonuclease/phosphatase family metal-dependent hydrolase